MALIVIEGPEGSGKTTLAHQFVDAGIEAGFDMRYVHHKYGDTQDWALEDEVWQVISDARAYPKRVYVYDRWWLSEYVYGTWDPDRIITLTVPVMTAHQMYMLSIIESDVPSFWLLLDAPVGVLASHRTPDDYPIPIATEKKLYQAMASQAWTRSEWPHTRAMEVAALFGRIELMLGVAELLEFRLGLESENGDER